MSLTDGITLAVLVVAMVGTAYITLKAMYNFAGTYTDETRDIDNPDDEFDAD